MKDPQGRTMHTGGGPSGFGGHAGRDVQPRSGGVGGPGGVRDMQHPDGGRFGGDNIGGGRDFYPDGTMPGGHGASHLGGVRNMQAEGAYPGGAGGQRDMLSDGTRAGGPGGSGLGGMRDY